VGFGGRCVVSERLCLVNRDCDESGVRWTEGNGLVKSVCGKRVSGFSEHTD